MGWKAIYLHALTVTVCSGKSAAVIAFLKAMGCSFAIERPPGSVCSALFASIFLYLHLNKLAWSWGFLKLLMATDMESMISFGHEPSLRSIK